jgi:hypothetical protein
MSMKNSNYTIGNRTRDFPVCSAACPRSRTCYGETEEGRQITKEIRTKTNTENTIMWEERNKKRFDRTFPVNSSPIELFRNSDWRCVRASVQMNQLNILKTKNPSMQCTWFVNLDVHCSNLDPEMTINIFKTVIILFTLSWRVTSCCLIQ